MGPLIGRRAEIERAITHLGAPSTGARSVLLEGQAGVGKTAVLAALVEHAGASEPITALGVALTAAETSMPWAGVAALCRGPLRDHLPVLSAPQRRALARACGQADPEQTDAERSDEPSPDVQPVAVGAALAALLDACVRHERVVLVLDDLHWLDTASAGAVAFAIRANAMSPLLLLAGSRPGARQLDVERLLPLGACLRIELPGLSVEAVQELLAERFGRVHHGPTLRRLHEISGGNPLYAIELGRQLSDGSALDAAFVPRSLDALIEQHLTSVVPAAGDVVAAAALLARPTATSLARVLGQIEDELLAAERAGVLEVRGDEIRFTHPLLRAGVLQRLPGIRRRQLARRLADAAAEPDEHARLRAEAAVAPDAEVAALLDEAGAQAFAIGAPGVAAERLERAAQLGAPTGAAAAARHLLLGRALARLGDVAGAAEHYRTARSLGLSADEEVLAIRNLAIVTHLREGIDAAVALLSAGIERDDLPAEGRYRLLWTMVYVLVAWDLRAADELAPRAQALAEETGDDVLRVEIALMAARVAFLRGRAVDLAPLLDRLGHVLSDVGIEPGGSEQVLLCELLCWSDWRDAAITGETTELARARAHGNVMAEANSLASLADALRRDGRWDDALAALQRWVEVTRLQGIEPTDEGNVAELAWLLAARGEHDEAARLAAAAVEGTKSVRLWHVQTSARAGFVALARGDIPAAIHELGAARDEADAAGLEDLCSLPFRDDLVEALVLAGQIDEADAEAARLVELAARSGRVRGRVAAARARALVDAARGALAEAELSVVAGLALAAELGDPFEEARLLLAGGVVARRSGRRTQSRDRLDAARQRFARLGAATFVGRADAELARLGDRTGQRDQLTHTEHQVALLVAAGRSNASTAAELFITPRTVEAHLTRIYRKLGVGSRAELIARRSELGVG